MFLKDANANGGQNGNSNNMQNMFSSAIVADSEWGTGVLQDVQEKYLGDVMFKEDISELKHDAQLDTRMQKKDNI